MSKEKSIEFLFCPKLHEPVASYFSNVYMTLLSVMQGMVIAGIITIIWETTKENSISITNTQSLSSNPIHRYLMLLTFSIVIWHKYINHHQLLGWQIVWQDSIIMFSFGIVQGILLLFLVHEDVLFYNIIWLIPAIGAIAYHHALKQHKQDYVKLIFYHHYCKNEFCSSKIYKFMITYEETLRLCTIVISLIFIVFAFIVNLFNHVLTEIVITFLTIIFMFIFLKFFDLKYMMINENLPCKKNGIKIDDLLKKY